MFEKEFLLNYYSICLIAVYQQQQKINFENKFCCSKNAIKKLILCQIKIKSTFKVKQTTLFRKFSISFVQEYEKSKNFEFVLNFQLSINRNHHKLKTVQWINSICVLFLC